MIDRQLDVYAFKSLGHSKYSLLGWSDGGITAMILAAAHPQCVHRMVVWGANATVTAEDIKLYETIRDTSKWSPKMREPLEGKACCFTRTMKRDQSGFYPGFILQRDQLSVSSQNISTKHGDIKEKYIKMVGLICLAYRGGVLFCIF